ncbi:hypothetical protein TELCIR_01098 [Teladorsagia circumcincta]|uniref:Uncharacterized protein n=1 Tax=Teladorsagia circumcincta TaxID=45464 RepID=A0A2G9V4Y2_TELCI|nr:hypothetical protein TELCIR_01098 [Teladorsagia circumcincta]
MELAIINGTYRSASEHAAAAAAAAQLKQPLAAALQAAALSAQARGVLPMLANNPALTRSPTMAVAGAPIVMSPGRGAAGAQQTQMLGLQSQLGAAAVAASNNAAAVAAQQAAILQQQQQAAEYQQLLFSQGLSYENLANMAAIQQFQQAQAQAAQQQAVAQAQQQYSLLGGQYADYAGVDIAATQTAPGGFLVRKWA